MRDRFDYATYRELLALIAKDNRNATFAEVANGLPADRFFLLRHDVDYAPGPALRLAEIEAAAGLRATYLLLPGAPTYDLLSPAHAGAARRLVELGHDVGLHYDARLLAPFPRDRWDRLLEAQADLLAALSGQEVRVIAMHQPALHGEDPFRDHARFLNAFGSPRLASVTYVSDSCRAWRDGAWQMLTEGPVPARLQLCLHPVNWDETDRDRVAIFDHVHREAATRILTERDWLQAEIAKHSGVREHEARRKRGG